MITIRFSSRSTNSNTLMSVITLWTAPTAVQGRSHSGTILGDLVRNPVGLGHGFPVISNPPAISVAPSGT
ncbi:MAG: hypothetical protein O6949_13005, partial [Chloroflexi bacterium]|nr:hypothetical protein [Chloroflexota bacterium]